MVTTHLRSLISDMLQGSADFNSQSYISFVPIYLHSPKEEKTFQSNANIYVGYFDSFHILADELQFLKPWQSPGTKLKKLPKSPGKKSN